MIKKKKFTFLYGIGFFLFLYGFIYSFHLAVIYGSIGIIYKRKELKKKKKFSKAKIIGSGGEFIGQLLGGYLLKKNYYYSFTFILYFFLFQYFVINLTILLMSFKDLKKYDNHSIDKVNWTIIFKNYNFLISIYFIFISACSRNIIRSEFILHIQNNFNISNEILYLSFIVGIVFSDVFIQLTIDIF